MYRTAKPKLSLSISTAAQSTTRPTLSLRSPVAMSLPRTPVSPPPTSPPARNPRLNQRGYSTMQQPNYSYSNSSSSRSILKKGQTPSSVGKRIQFHAEPTVYCVTPIEDMGDYYGAYVKMSKDERRWGARR